MEISPPPGTFWGGAPARSAQGDPDLQDCPCLCGRHCAVQTPWYDQGSAGGERLGVRETDNNAGCSGEYHGLAPLHHAVEDYFRQQAAANIQELPGAKWEESPNGMCESCHRGFYPNALTNCGLAVAAPVSGQPACGVPAAMRPTCTVGAPVQLQQPVPGSQDSDDISYGAIDRTTTSLCRSQFMRPLHPPGPLATHTGSAQVTGLLKERSQDYYVAAEDIAFEGGYYCSQTSWTDCAGDGCIGHVPEAFGDFSGNGYGSAAACSTSDNGTGVVSSTTAAGAPSSIVVTGVFDGHGGEMSARYAQQAVLSYVANDRELHQALGNGDVEATEESLRGVFRRVDSELLSLAAAAAADPPAATAAFPSSSCCSSTLSSSASPSAVGVLHSPNGIINGFSNGVNTNGKGDFHDGTTALVTLQLGGLLAVANAGDSRAVLCRGGQAVRLSRDHTPGLRAERERIEAAGGRVVVARGAARVLVPLAGRTDVMQALSVSRSLGDPDFKASGLLISDPDVSVVPLLPGEDQFLIAASDGLWGRVGDQEAVDCVREVLGEYSRMSSPSANRASAAKAAARRLLRLALDQGSVDDVTVVVSNGDVEATEESLRGVFRRVDSELLSLAAAAAADPPAATAAFPSSSCCSSTLSSSASPSAVGVLHSPNGIINGFSKRC
ncbi:hypothetical protein VOLCADRAFT_92494 [Volvox carteri f. nagariensis]|uniref:PPM-type phosphatase domain-containing protein n=1 Tax=Volvox carteri f. nagariensis TaxID=3068 RepID=D8TZT2_VOLCA|nr:uncharacterized protein VOLCADRAFT_92494 [Volvox carteri f. nagariensis]EFJ46979.1 hypothetical protein VOLCADRAFT_92494 [Volvox carteri f. nagariensis]|eukprot:XP_002951874.1 hypothetical protein VOLCADRAFT_92494 [Volvox carteri f. nagariensis]